MGSTSGADFVLATRADFGCLATSQSVARRVVRLLESSIALLAWFSFSAFEAGDPWEAWAARAIATAPRGGCAVVIEEEPSSPLWTSPLTSAAMTEASFSTRITSCRSFLGSISCEMQLAYSWDALPLARQSGQRRRHGLDHAARPFSFVRALESNVASGSALVGCRYAD